MFHSTTVKDGTAGFTLIEALVALTIVAIAMASIGGLIASSAHGVSSIDGHLIRLETARAIMSALPDRAQLVPGTVSGKIADHPWRIDVLPFMTQNASAQAPATQWLPQAIIATVQSPNGAAMKISTIRLQRSNQR